MIPRLIASALWLLPGICWVWALLWLFHLACAAGAGALPVLFAGGAISLLVLPMFAFGAIVGALVPASWLRSRQGIHISRRRLVIAGAVLPAALVSSRFVLEPVADALVPGVDLRAAFVEAAAWGLAGTLACAATAAILWRARPLALACPACVLLAVRGLGHDSLRIAFTGRELILEVSSAVILLGSIALLARRLATHFARFRHATWGIGAVSVVSLFALFALYGSRPAAKAAFVDRLPGPAALVGAARSAYDLDGDGYSSILGGADCDDGDPDVHPAAIEIVGNGIDDNCAGGDLASWRAPVDVVTAAATRKRSVVLLTVDALRADMLHPGQMDHLLAFAAKGAHFERAYAAASLTDYALRSMMTGRYPMDFADGKSSFAQEPTLAERLAAVGYRTVALHSVWTLNPYTLQGFAEVDDQLSAQNEGFGNHTSEETTARAIALFRTLQDSGQPFFLWVHYYDPHSDYVSRKGAPSYGESFAGRYRQEVWATDRDLGRLLSLLEASGFADVHLVVVSADHGELIGEHGAYGHPYWLDEQVTRVPLVLRGGNIPAGVVSARVRTIDLYPTLLFHALGVEFPSDGVRLDSVLAGEETADRDVFSVSQYGQHYSRAAWIGDWKLTQNITAGTERLSNLADDPAEQSNLIDTHSAEASRLRDAIGARWDASFNDQMLARKAARGRERLMQGPLHDRYQRHKYEYYCKQGVASACAALKGTQQ